MIIVCGRASCAILYRQSVQYSLHRCVSRHCPEQYIGHTYILCKSVETSASRATTLPGKKRLLDELRETKRLLNESQSS